MEANAIRVIISELYVDKKTIESKGVGGIAGGAKYNVQGLVFKFSLDSPVQGGWLYGRTKRHDEKG